MGFTLIELLVAAAIGLITTTVAGQVMIDQFRTGQQIEERQQLRDNWNRTSTFLTSEINLSQSLTASQNNIPGCGFASGDVKLVVNFQASRNLPPAVYYVKKEEAGWRDHQLWRCGPSIDYLGNYISNSISDNVIIDGLSGLNGFTALISSGNQHASFNLELSGLKNNAYRQSDGSRTRLQEVANRPSIYSRCTQFTPSGTSTPSTTTGPDTITLSGASNDPICGFGGGDNITGSTGNDVIEAGGTISSTLNGGDGNDRLHGSYAADTLDGGNGDDTLIGGGGNDSMTGGSGINHYLPDLNQANTSCDRDTVVGSASGYDIIHIPGPEADYNHTNCTNNLCRVLYPKEQTTVQDQYYVDIIQGNELVFTDSVVNIPDGAAPSLSSTPIVACTVNTTPYTATPTPDPTPEPTSTPVGPTITAVSDCNSNIDNDDPARELCKSCVQSDQVWYLGSESCEAP